MTHLLQCSLSKPVLLLAALLCISGPGFAQGKGEGVQVRAVSPTLQDAKPGHVFSVSFVVTSRSAAEEEFIENLRLPSGWQSIIPVGSFRLRPSETTTRLVAFQVPLGIAAGTYKIDYRARSQRDYAIQDADTVTVAVLPVTNLALLVEEKPDSVIAGATYQVRLRLANRSNVPLTISLKVKSEEKYPARIAPDEASIDPGQSVPVVVTVRTDSGERRPGTHCVQVEARAVGVDDANASAGATVGVEVIPRVTDRVDEYHRLPVEVTLGATGSDGDDSVFVEARGEGTLDEEGSKSVEFLFRGPDTQDKSTFGLRDEYRLNLLTDDIDVRLGDQSYGLSRLTSYYRYGRGVGMDFHPAGGPSALGAYYLDWRWTSPQRNEYGLYASHQVTDGLSARINLLRQERDMDLGRPAIHDTIWSVEATSKPTENMNVQVEYARCDSSREGGIEDSAYSIEWDGRIGQAGYYRAAKYHAGPDYYGYYHDSDHSYASLSYPLASQVQAHASYNRYEANLDLQPDRGPAPRESLLQAGASYRVNHEWDISLDYDDFERYDRFAASQFDYREQAVRLGVGRSTEKYGLRAEIRGGNQQDRLRGDSATVWNCNLSGTCHPRRDTAFTLYAGFGDDDALEGSRLLRESTNVGASVVWKPRPDTKLDFWYTKYNLDAPDRPQSDQYDFRLSRRLANSHDVAVRVRHNTGHWEHNETSYMLTYTIPFSIPVGHKKAIGSIRGRVYDAEAPEHPGLAGAILRINQATAVSDAKGNFIFPSVVPGTYHISVDLASVGLDKVTQQRLPLTVEVTDREAVRVEVGVLHEARVSGKVLQIPANGNGSGKDGAVAGDPRRNGDASHEPAALSNILVELANDQEVLRRVTDEKGEFLFAGARPGSWHLKVYDHGLPAYYQLETPEQDVTLEAAQRAQITVRALPKTRQIRFVDQGTIQPKSN